MPPKVKVSEGAILAAGIEIVREKGIIGVNARDIGKILGCSVQPIFSNFENMEALKDALYRLAEYMFDDYMRQGMSRHKIPFLGMGLAYIDFAKTEQNVFKYLFMSDVFKGRSVLNMIRAEENKEIVDMIAGMTGLDFKSAEQLFLSIWLITHGIAALMATNDCDFSEETISKLLMDTFSGMKIQLKG